MTKNNITFDAPAKINLHLHITGRRDDGYHLLDSLVVKTNIFDTIQIKDSSEYQLIINHAPDCPIDDNIITRAINLIAKHFNIEPNIQIKLNKNIPMGAGLGGGSADAAMTLRALSNFWNLDTPNELLEKFATQLGSDVVAALSENPVIMRDTGNILLPAPHLPTIYGVLVYPQTPCPTPQVYKSYAESDHKFSNTIIFPKSFDSIKTLCAFLKSYTRNDLTDAAITVNPMVDDVLKYLSNLQNGLLTRMSGSGSSCYTLFENEDASIKQSHQIQKERPDWWVRVFKT